MNKLKMTRIYSQFLIGGLILLLNSCFNSDTVEPTPTPIPAQHDFVAIAAGYSHSLALCDDEYSLLRTLWAWGDNTFSQLGDSTTINRNRLVYIGFGYTAIAAGGTHSLALKYDTLFAWGDNRLGQLGDGTYLDKNSPEMIGSEFSIISAGFSHSLALKRDGTLWAWGDNTYGQLGDGTNEVKNTPVHIGSGYSRIAAGGKHSLALKTDGTLWAWGNNEYGQVGDGTNENRNTPVLIDSGFSMISFSTIAAGGRHSLALKNDTLFAWGDNQYGQLGDGTNTSRTAPVKVYTPLLEDYRASEVAAGDSHSLLLEPNGALWAWGRNDFGQAGGGTYLSRNTLALIGSGYDGVNTGRARIAAGGFHSFVLKEEWITKSFLGIIYTDDINHLWGFGDNQFGQLGCGPFPKFTNTARPIGRN